MKNIAALLDEPDTTVAVVGATDNPAKYGYLIYRDLKRKGFTVFPVNPNRTTVDGDETFASCDELPARPTIVNIVVPPWVTVEILEKCLELGLKNVWVQPGAESSEVMSYLEDNDFNYLANACIMVQSRRKGE
jgi:predicted CoA-binding protein